MNCNFSFLLYLQINENKEKKKEIMIYNKINNFHNFFFLLCLNIYFIEFKEKL